MNRRGLIIAVLAAVIVPMIVFAAGNEKKTEPSVKKIKVVTTLFPFADWARFVGGPYVEVTCLLPPGASPHTYELAPRDAKAMKEAQLVISNGEGLDDWVQRLVETSANQDLKKLVLADHFPPVAVPKLIEDEHHEDQAEHQGHHHGNIAGCGMWLDPMRAVQMVNLIAQYLSQIDPDHAAHFYAQADRYWSLLDRLDQVYRQRLSTVKGGFIAFHEAFVYPFHRYGVQLYGVVEPYPGKEPSVDYIRKLTERVSGKPVRGVLTEPQLSDKPAAVLAEQLKVPLIRVDPNGGEGLPGRGSYIELMMYNLDQLAPTSVREGGGDGE